MKKIFLSFIGLVFVFSIGFMPVSEAEAANRKTLTDKRRCAKAERDVRVATNYLQKYVQETDRITALLYRLHKDLNRYDVNKIVSEYTQTRYKGYAKRADKLESATLKMSKLCK